MFRRLDKIRLYIIAVLFVQLAAFSVLSRRVYSQSLQSPFQAAVNAAVEQKIATLTSGLLRLDSMKPEAHFAVLDEKTATLEKALSSIQSQNSAIYYQNFGLVASMAGSLVLSILQIKETRRKRTPDSMLVS